MGWANEVYGVSRALVDKEQGECLQISRVKNTSTTW